ncbi:MAG: DEAD/DEAH box helicase [Proteobacteria bacterium]|nr:DEAD/DEAH box helicase [Pseudomonadota bacterium]
MNSITETENIVPALGEALSQRGYDVLTPVQQAILGPGLGDADLLVSAQTGSGKTVAFGLAVAPTLLAGAERFVSAEIPLALVVAPTRELALQVKRELDWLYAMTGASIASCVGGMDMREERWVLQHGAHIVVGTPGRLRDHIERGSFNTKGLRAVVLDEADEMLDLGFREDLEFILGAAPKSRRTLMFSATVPSSIATLARRYQRNAVRLSTTAEQAQHVDIEYRALTVAPMDRENAIINVLRYFEAKNALVFCATRAAVNRMTSRLNNRGFSVVALSGELSQNERTHALQAMRDGRARVCVATDVAARGIDLPNLELVIHADIPKTRITLLHRSGRTGRAGRKGVCVLIVATNDRRRSERLLESANIKAIWARPPSVDEIVERDRERILDDPMLSEPVNPDELPFAQTLLERHGGEQIAAAFLRLHSAGRSAPEELLDVAASGRADRPGRYDRQERGERPAKRERHREDFTGGVWFSLSVGSRQSAEARWLLPMLCRYGKLTTRDVGAIKVRPDDTNVELAPEAVERFLAAIGPSRIVDGKITVTALDGKPSENRDAHAAPGTGGTAAAPKIFKKPAVVAAGEARPEQPTSPYEKRKGVGDETRKPYEKHKGAGDGTRKPYEKHKGAGDGTRKPYERHKGAGDGTRKPYEKRKTAGDETHTAYGKPKGVGDGTRAPYAKRKTADDGARTPYEKRKNDGDSAHAPHKKKSKPARKPDAPAGDRTRTVVPVVQVAPAPVKKPSYTLRLGTKSASKAPTGPTPTSKRKADPTIGGGGKPKPGSTPLRRKKTPT